MIRATAAQGQIRAFAAVTKETVNEAHIRHMTTPVITAALGRLLTAAAMMGWQMKADTDRLNLRIEGDGPVQSLDALSNNMGQVWGYPKNPQVDLPLNAKGKLDVSGAIGKGVLSVISDLGLKEPYVGQIQLVSGEIAEDITYYYTVSEQIPSAVALGVLVDVDQTVKAAGGFILQVMPGASDEAIDALVSKVSAFSSVTSYFAQGHTPEDLLTDLLGDMELEITDRREVSFHCSCSRERVTSALLSLGEDELLDMAHGEEEVITLHCNLCNEPYDFTKTELLELAQAAAKAKKEKAERRIEEKEEEEDS